MVKRNIFYKKSIISKRYLIIFFFIFSLFIFLFLLLINSKPQFFIVSDFIGSFYIIPEVKGGIKVMNLDKKSLHINDEMSSDIEITNDSLLKYSIQVFSSSDYYLVKKKLDFMINQNNNYTDDLSLKINDFFIVVLNTDLGKEYMILYKSFFTRELASNYCLKYINFLKRCLIVNAKYLN